jgi:hypothetical protein
VKTIEYHTIEDFVAAATVDESEHKSACKPTSEWNGGATLREAASLARRGWPAAADRVSRLAAEVADATASIVERAAASLTYGVEGLWVDEGRLVTGEPECCVSTATLDDCVVRKIVVNISANAAVCPDALFSAGAATLAAIDALESTGRRCEVWIGSGSERFGDRKTLQVLVMVKGAGQPLDVDRLAFLLCHPAALRRLMFSVEEDAGFSPGNCRTSPLDVPDATVTPEASSNASAEARRETVSEVCRVLGIADLHDAATLTQDWSH